MGVEIQAKISISRFLDLRNTFAPLAAVGAARLQTCGNDVHGLAILNSGEPAWRDHAHGFTIFNSRVPTALSLRVGRKNEIMRMISSFRKISKFGATAARAHSLTHLLRTPARLNRYPRITDAGDNFGSNLGLFGSGRGSNGRGAPVGFIWTNFQLKRSHGDPFHAQNLVFVQPVPTRELQGARKSPL